MTSKVSNLTAELQGMTREAAIMSTPFTNAVRAHLEKAYKAGQKSYSFQADSASLSASFTSLKKAVNELKPSSWSKGVPFSRVNNVTSALWEMAYWSGAYWG